jgi:hypothetical protein
LNKYQTYHELEKEFLWGLPQGGEAKIATTNTTRQAAILCIHEVLSQDVKYQHETNERACEADCNADTA